MKNVGLSTSRYLRPFVSENLIDLNSIMKIYGMTRNRVHKLANGQRRPVASHTLCIWPVHDISVMLMNITSCLTGDYFSKEYLRVHLSFEILSQHMQNLLSTPSHSRNKILLLREKSFLDKIYVIPRHAASNKRKMIFQLCACVYRFDVTRSLFSTPQVANLTNLSQWGWYSCRCQDFRKYSGSCRQSAVYLERDLNPSSISGLQAQPYGVREVNKLRAPIAEWIISRTWLFCLRSNAFARCK